MLGHPVAIEPQSVDLGGDGLRFGQRIAGVKALADANKVKKGKRDRVGGNRCGLCGSSVFRAFHTEAERRLRKSEQPG